MDSQQNFKKKVFFYDFKYLPKQKALHFISN